MRLAMSWRARDSRSVVPRKVEGTTWRAGAGAAPGAGAWAAAWAGPACPSAAAGGTSRIARAASSTSCLRIRPPTPVPVTVPRLTPCSVASLRTSGVTYGPSAWPGAATDGAGPACGCGLPNAGGGAGGCVYPDCGCWEYDGGYSGATAVGGAGYPAWAAPGGPGG